VIFAYSSSFSAFAPYSFNGFSGVVALFLLISSADRWFVKFLASQAAKPIKCN